MTRDELVAKIDSCEEKINELRQQVNSILAPVKAKDQRRDEIYPLLRKERPKTKLKFLIIAMVVILLVCDLWLGSVTTSYIQICIALEVIIVLIPIVRLIAFGVKKASLKAELKSLNNELSSTDAKTKPVYNEINAVRNELNNYEEALENIDKYETRCNRLFVCLSGKRSNRVSRELFVDGSSYGLIGDNKPKSYPIANGAHIIMLKVLDSYIADSPGGRIEYHTVTQEVAINNNCACVCFNYDLINSRLSGQVLTPREFNDMTGSNI